MTEFHSKTGVLVFIRSEAEELNVKTFNYSIGRQGNRSLIKQLNKNVIRQAKRSHLPTFILTGKNQVGSSFGARLANGFEGIFKKGFDRVIAIGNDCLAVNPALLLHAENHLDQADIVLGPTCDGGAYLIGLSKQAFRKKSFIQLEWETEHLFRGIKSYSQHLQLKVALLNKASDIDNATDFQKALRQLPFFCSLRKQLESILYRAPIYQPATHLFSSIIVKTSFHLRAPPAAFF